MFTSKQASKALLAVSLALSPATLTAQSAQQEGVARQVQALKAMMENFSGSMRTRVENLETFQASAEAFQASTLTCASSASLYAPGHALADSDGCVASDSSVAVVPNASITNTGQVYAAGRRGIQPKEIYRVAGHDTFSRLTINMVTTHVSYTYEDSDSTHTYTYTNPPAIEINNAGSTSWVTVGDTTTILVATGGQTILNGQIISGSWTGRIAAPRVCNTRAWECRHNVHRAPSSPSISPQAYRM